MTHGWLRSGYRLNPFSLPLLSSSTSESKSICILSEEDDKREEKDEGKNILTIQNIFLSPLTYSPIKNEKEFVFGE